MALIRTRDYQGAYTQAVEALRQDPKNPLAFFLLGVVAFDTGTHDKATEFFAKACAHEPRNVRYQSYYARALNFLGQNTQAKTQADMAAALGTKDALLADMIGTVYSRTGYHERATPFFKQAVKLNPKWANFHFNLGASAEFTGDFKTAKAAYQKAVSIKPEFHTAWFALTAIETQKADGLEKLKAVFESTGDNADARLLIGHSVAKTLEDLERHEESFDWLCKAKALKKNQVGYSAAETARIFAAAKMTAQTTQGPRPASPPSSTTTPLFIIGLPRTGTTLVERILSSHPQVRSAGELTLFSDLIKTAVGAPPNLPLTAEGFHAAREIDLPRIGEHYRQRTGESEGQSQGPRYLIDKMPLNFFYAGLINRALPDAKIIVLRRGAMDSCLSNYRQLFATHNRHYDYGYDIENMAHYYREFDSLTAHWQQTLAPERFRQIAYEDIVFDQENQTRGLLEFCGLPWDEACMRFHENTSAVATASAVQVRRALYSGSIQRWKRYGAKVDGLRAALGDLAE